MALRRSLWLWPLVGILGLIGISLLVQRESTPKFERLIGEKLGLYKDLESSVSPEAKNQLSIAKEYDLKTAEQFKELTNLSQGAAKLPSEPGDASNINLIKTKSTVTAVCIHATRALEAQAASFDAIKAIDEELAEKTHTLEKQVKIYNASANIMEDISGIKDVACEKNSG